MATPKESQSEGCLEPVIPCEVCQAPIASSKYIQHAQAHATLVIPDQYEAFTQIKGDERWLNNEGATGYLKPDINIKQQLQQKENKIITSYGYVRENYDNMVPDIILTIIISYHDTLYIDTLEKGHIFYILNQERGNTTNNGKANKLKVFFENESSSIPISIETTIFKHKIEWKDIQYVCTGCLTPIFMERKQDLIIMTNIAESDLNKLCFSIVGKTHIFDCFVRDKKDELIVKIFVDALRFFLKQNKEESMQLAKRYLKDNLYEHSIPAFNQKQKSLMLLQQDLFVMTMGTIFRNLEEEGVWIIDQQVREIFNAETMYAMALREDVPWRQWNHWAREKIVGYLQNNQKCKVQYGNPILQHQYRTPLSHPVQHQYPTPTSPPQYATRPTPTDQECLVM